MKLDVELVLTLRAFLAGYGRFQRSGQETQDG